MKEGDRISVKLVDENEYIDGVIRRQLTIFQIVPDWVRYNKKKISIGCVVDDYFYYFKSLNNERNDLMVTKMILNKQYDDILYY